MGSNDIGQMKQPQMNEPALDNSGADITMSGQAPLLSPPAMSSNTDYGLETVSHTPKLIRSLMHRKVIKISSGGVHNICIVEQ